MMTIGFAGLLVTFAQLLYYGAGQSSNFIYEMVMNEADKANWLHAHNYRRSTVLPTAANMDKLEWDDELAREASKFVRNCKFEHSNPPLQSERFGQLGENLFAGDQFRYRDIPFGVVSVWYNEVKDYELSRNPRCIDGKECGHYTQLVWADTTHVGCATSVCSHIFHGNGRHLIACMYGPAGNKMSSDLTQLPPYKVGESCSECPEDHVWCIAGLCSST